MISGFIGLGYGPFMKAATYQMDEGVKQGDMEATSIFCIGINQANKCIHDSLKEKGGIILSGADDTYILGPPEIVFHKIFQHRHSRFMYPRYICIHAISGIITSETSDLGSGSEDTFRLWNSRVNLTSMVFTNIASSSDCVLMLSNLHTGTNYVDVTLYNSAGSACTSTYALNYET